MDNRAAYRETTFSKRSMFEWECLHHLIKRGAPDRGDWQVPRENNQI